MRTRVGRRKNRKLAVIVLLALAYVIWCLFKPLPELVPQSTTATLKAKAPPSKLEWPTSQAAVTVVGTKILETNNQNKPVAAASTAKIITALVILGVKPLSAGQTGPTITLTDKDVAIYKDYVGRDGSVVPVVAGEQITQYQALQAIMLPSANNMADSLAIWAFGSLKNYADAANAYLKGSSINDTTVGSDASGLSATTTTTAADMAKLGYLAMQNPVLAGIVGQSTATIPVANTVKNVNDLIGMYGIVGVKTGNSDEAGGAFVSASKAKVDDKDQVIVTAVAGAPSLFQAMKQSIPLLKSAQTNFTQVTVAKKDQVVGTYFQPWGGRIDAIVEQSLTGTAWNGSTLLGVTDLKNLPATSHAGADAGSIAIKRSTLNDRKTVGVVLKSGSSQPTIWWRLAHPLGGVFGG